MQAKPGSYCGKTLLATSIATSASSNYVRRQGQRCSGVYSAVFCLFTRLGLLHGLIPHVTLLFALLGARWVVVTVARSMLAFGLSLIWRAGLAMGFGVSCLASVAGIAGVCCSARRGAAGFCLIRVLLAETS